MSETAKPLRVDAARNREALLVAAEAEFAQHGASASVADIARRAGVAKGTVFRHYATKEDLMVAIVSGHLALLNETAGRLAATEDPEQALLDFLTVAADQRRQHDIDFLVAASESDPRVMALRDDLLAGIDRLVGHARAAGVIRADVTTTDVYLLMCAPVHVVDNLRDPSPDLWRRYLAIIFDGLRPAGANPLPAPAPTLTA